MYDQQSTADQLHKFLQTWGLKAKFVAQTCTISENIFSKFMSKKVALSTNQLSRVQHFMEDYIHRNS